MASIILATTNPGKGKEVQTVLGDKHQVLTLKDFNIKLDVPETGTSFAENAFQKLEAYLAALRAIPQALNSWVLTEDSGIEVDELGGKPGVATHRWAFDGERPLTGPEVQQKLLDELAGIPQEARGARFIAALAIARNTLKGELPTRPYVFEGEVRGTILQAPQDQDLALPGFHFSPLFAINSIHAGQGDEVITLARIQQMSKEGQAAAGYQSHRTQALQYLADSRILEVAA